MVELTARYTLGKLVLWAAAVLLFALFVFTIASVQVNVSFSDEKLTEDKRSKISGEVFGNIVYHVLFIGLLLILGIVGYLSVYSRTASLSVSSEPGELAS